MSRAPLQRQHQLIAARFDQFDRFLMRQIVYLKIRYYYSLYTLRLHESDYQSRVETRLNSLGSGFFQVRQTRTSLKMGPLLCFNYSFHFKHDHKSLKTAQQTRASPAHSSNTSNWRGNNKKTSVNNK